MKGVSLIGVFTLGVAIADPATAQSMRGTWCPEEPGNLVYMDEQGIGFGDHISCEVSMPPPTDQLAYAAAATCTRTYSTGSFDANGHEVFYSEQDTDVSRIVAVLLPDGRLALNLDAYNQTSILTRCDF